MMLGESPKSRRTFKFSPMASKPNKPQRKKKDSLLSNFQLDHIRQRLRKFIKNESAQVQKPFKTTNNTPKHADVKISTSRNHSKHRMKRVSRSKVNSKKSTPRHSEIPLNTSDQRKFETNPSTRRSSCTYTLESLPKIASYAHRTRQGLIPEDPLKVNQDTYFEFPNLGPLSDIFVFGVCDGHGAYGHYVSSYVTQRLHILLAKNPALSTDIKSVLITAISQCNQELSTINVDVSLSGTTLILVVIQGKNLWCANVGDSRAILAREVPQNRQWLAVSLSRDHKPDLPEEMDRIDRSGGRVQSYLDQFGKPAGPARVWLKDKNSPGLAMSRSLGDALAASVGVIPTPDILQIKLTDADKFIVIGSDGLFEFTTNEDIVKACIPHWKMGDPNSALEDIESEAVWRWKQQEDVIDDITGICIFLDIN